MPKSVPVIKHTQSTQLSLPAKLTFGLDKGPRYRAFVDMPKLYKRPALFCLILLTIVLSQGQFAYGQCVRIKDPRAGNRLTLTPAKNFACLTANAPRNQSVLAIEFESNVANIQVNWGDGTPVQTIAGPTATVQHTFPDTGTYTYRITQPGCATPITGLYINQFNTRSPGIGFIFPPAGNDNKRCLPSPLQIINASPGMNGFTEFLIDWGGREQMDTVDYRSFNQAIVHTYKKESKICRTRITVTYRNLCGMPPGTPPLSQSAGDYFFISKDSAVTTPSKIILCQMEDLIINDASLLHCLDTSGRKISWNVVKGFAGGLPIPGDGIFRTYNTPANKRLVIPRTSLLPIPADSIYRVNLMLRNQCGTDTAEINILLAQPKNPVFRVLNNNSCPGDIVSFQNQTGNQYPEGTIDWEWDFGDGSPVTVNNAPTVEHPYLIGGTYTVKLRSVVTSTISRTKCVKESSIQILVKRSVTPIVTLTPKSLCNAGVVTLKNKSVNTQFVVWRGWSLADTPTFSAGTGMLPVMQAGQDTSIVVLRGTNATDSSAIVAYKQYGGYVVRLKAQSAGCPEFTSIDTLKVFPTPALRWSVSSRKACVGSPVTIRDSSIVFATQPRGLPASFRNLIWKLDMGDSTVYRNTVPVAGFFDNPILSNRLTRHAYRRPGSYVIKLSVFSGNLSCPVIDSLRVTVLASPKPLFTVRKDRCNNSKVTLVNNMADSADFYEFEVYRGMNRYISFVRTNKEPYVASLPYIPPGDSTYYQIYLKTYRISNVDTCVSISAPVRIGVAPTPVAAINVSATTGCQPMNNITFANASFNLAQDTSNRFFWSFGNGNTSALETPPAQNYLNPGLVLKADTVRFSITRRDGCVFSTEREILIFPSPNAQIVAADSVCSGVPVDFAATGNNIASYQWQWADYDGTSSVSATPSKTFTNFTNQSKTYTVELLARTINNCPQTLLKTIKIFPQPRVDVAITTRPDGHCSPLPVQFQYQNVSGASQFEWKWSNGDSLIAASDTAFTKTFINNTIAPQQIGVVLVAGNGACFTRIERNFLINPRVEARFDQNVTQNCSPVQAMLINQSSAGADKLTWFIGNTIVQDQQVVSRTLVNSRFDRDTTLRIRLVARNSLAGACLDTIESSVLVHPKPVLSGISLPNTTSFCSPYHAQITGSGFGIKTYNWNFGDGIIATDSLPGTQHTFENYNPTADRTFTVRLIGTNRHGCADTAERSVSVKPFVGSGIVIIDTAGCAPFTARLSSGASINANVFDWSFAGTGSSNQANPNHTFTNFSDSVQTQVIRLIARKQQVAGCSDTAYQTVKVYPNPIPSFSLSQQIGCGPLPVRFTNSTTGAARSYYVISSGGASDTVASTTAIFDTTFSNPNLLNKSIQIDLYAVSALGCVVKQTKFITVYADLTAEFRVDTAGCSPYRVQIRNFSSNLGGNWQWNMGDRNTYSTREPQHVYTYTGPRDTVYVLKLTSISAVGGCSRSDSVRIHVYGRPNVSFDVSPAQRLQLPANQLTVTNHTPHNTAWRYAWTFGDPGVDTTSARQFIHTYNFQNEDFTDTNFTIRAIATSVRGCADTAVHKIIIQPEAPKPEFTYSNPVGCSPVLVAFRNESQYGREYHWDFGDNAISEEKHPSHNYSASGLYTVTLTVKGFGGTSSIVKREIINVKTFPKATFYVSRFEVIIPEEPARFRPDVNCDSCTYLWTLGDGSTSTQMQPVHYYEKEGTYKVTLKVTSPNGCENYYEKDAAVRAVTDQLVLTPNVFKPNVRGSNGGFTDPQDRDNTIFYPYTQGANRIKLQIFNRWGQMLYQSTTIGKGWDGYIENGKMAPSGTYAYFLEVELLTGEIKKKVGDVTILR